MPLTETILDALTSSHVPLDPGSLAVVLANRLGSVPTPEDLGTALRDLLGVDAITLELVGENGMPALAIPK